MKRTTIQFEDKIQILENTLYTPLKKIQCVFGSFTEWTSFDAIAYPSGKIQRFIRLEKEDKQPTAFEFYNSQTGHCYVDYIEKVGMTEKEGYIKIPLYRK